LAQAARGMMEARTRSFDNDEAQTQNVDPAKIKRPVLGEFLASTVEHLYLELSLYGVPYEIVVVDDGSTDFTWQILRGKAAKTPTLRPIQNPDPHDFGRAINRGLDSMAGDAVVIMMADESDDCRSAGSEQRQPFFCLSETFRMWRPHSSTFLLLQSK
jgi:hypothetical protein